MSIIARILVGGIFVYSGWNKLVRPPQEFQYVIEQYQVFPAIFAKLVSYTIPWVEFIFGAFLIIGFFRMWSARILSCLCTGFIALLSSTLIRKINIGNCGCFGEGIHLTPTQALMLDSSLLLMLLYLSFVSKRKLELDSWLYKEKLP